MTIRKPLVLGDDGLPQNLQPGDAISAPTNAPSINVMLNGEVATPLVIGMPVYTSAADTVKRAQANAKSTATLAGLVYDPSIAAGATGNIVESGILTATTGQWDAITGQTGGLTFASNYFLDAANPGKLTVTPPTTPGQVNTLVGYAQSTVDMVILRRDPILL